jgi:putative endonuclease
MAYLYILYSKNLNQYYTGSCRDFISRYREHKEIANPASFTSKTQDWEVFLVLDNLQYKQARKMELHIKRMKSAIYITNLKKYPEIIEKLRLRYLE